MMRYLCVCVLLLLLHVKTLFLRCVHGWIWGEAVFLYCWVYWEFWN